MRLLGAQYLEKRIGHIHDQAVFPLADGAEGGVAAFAGAAHKLRLFRGEGAGECGHDQGGAVGTQHARVRPGPASGEILKEILHIGELFRQRADGLVLTVEGIRLGDAAEGGGVQMARVHDEETEHLRGADEARLLHKFVAPDADGVQRFVKPGLLDVALLGENALGGVFCPEAAEQKRHKDDDHKENQSHAEDGFAP